jgi:hypothetical protein
MGWMGLFFNIYFERKLIQIRDMLLPVELTVATKQGATSSEATSLLEAGRHPRALFPAWCSIDLDSYLTRRSKLVKRLCPHMPNRQHTLFWFESEGPHFHMLLLQINLIFIGLSCASLLLTFFPAVFKACSLSVFYMYVILAVVPLLYIALKKQQMVATMSQVSCMGSFRRPDVIATVIREQKTAHVVRAFLVLEKMYQAAHTNHTPTNNMDQEILFDGQELADITTTFEAFDKNGDGNLLSTEIATVVTALVRFLFTLFRFYFVLELHVGMVVNIFCVLIFVLLTGWSHGAGEIKSHDLCLGHGYGWNCIKAGVSSVVWNASNGIKGQWC